MFLNRHLGFFFFILTPPVVCGAGSEVPPTIGMEWAKRTYEAVAPQPFGQVSFSIAVSPEGKVIDINILVDSKNIPVEASIYEDLGNPSEIDIGYSNPLQTSTESVEYIGFYFEEGDLYQFELGDNVPGCAPPCFDEARDIIEIRIYADMSIQRKNYSLRKPGGNGT